MDSLSDDDVIDLTGGGPGPVVSHASRKRQRVEEIDLTSDVIPHTHDIVDLTLDDEEEEDDSDDEVDMIGVIAAPPKAKHRKGNGKKKRKREETAVVSGRGGGGGGAAAAAEGEEDCTICFDALDQAKVKNLRCGHRFHNECMKRHILTCLTEMKIPVPCPLCRPVATLNENETKQFLSKTEMKRYQQAMEQQEVMRNPNLRHCPTADCTHVYNKEKLKNSKGKGAPKCPLCSKDLPLNDESNEGEAELQEYAKKHKLRQCRRCGARIEHAAGCMKMRCRCGYCFCYQCGKEGAKCKCTGSEHGFLSTETVRRGNGGNGSISAQLMGLINLDGGGGAPARRGGGGGAGAAVAAALQGGAAAAAGGGGGGMIAAGGLSRANIIRLLGL